MLHVRRMIESVLCFPLFIPYGRFITASDDTSGDRPDVISTIAEF
jgi:hypothetical protein